VPPALGRHARAHLHHRRGHQPSLPLVEERHGLGEEPLQVLFADLYVDTKRRD